MSYPAHGQSAADDIPAGRRIVVGVDGSAASVAALAWAAGEARLRHAKLVAVYAWEPAGQSRAPYAAHMDRLSREESRMAAASLLSESVRTAFGQHPPPRLRVEVAEGRPERVLPSRCAGAEMLVLGCTRQAGDLPAAPGPVHRACLQGAPCPLAVVGCLTALASDRHGLGQPAGEGTVWPERSAASGCPARRGAAGSIPQRIGQRVQAVTAQS